MYHTHVVILCVLCLYEVSSCISSHTYIICMYHTRVVILCVLCLYEVSSCISSYTYIGLGYMYVSHTCGYTVCVMFVRGYSYHCKCVHSVVMSLQFITNLQDKINM